MSTTMMSRAPEARYPPGMKLIETNDALEENSPHRRTQMSDGAKSGKNSVKIMMTTVREASPSVLGKSPKSNFHITTNKNNATHHHQQHNAKAASVSRALKELQLRPNDPFFTQDNNSAMEEEVK